MLGISFYGYGIAVDQNTPGQMYNVFAETDGYRASDWSIYGLGTAAIRMYVSDVPASINTVTTSDNRAGKAYAVNGNIVTTGNGESVAVYNLTGKLVATGVAGRDIKIAAKGLYIVKVGNKATKVVVR